jgi:hypothetical protein
VLTTFLLYNITREPPHLTNLPLSLIPYPLSLLPYPLLWTFGSGDFCPQGSDALCRLGGVEWGWWPLPPLDGGRRGRTASEG